MTSANAEHPRSSMPARTLLAMCGLSLCVGVISGVGAWIFRVLIGFVHNLFFLGQFSASYDANVHTAVNPWGAGIPWVKCGLKSPLFTASQHRILNSVRNM